MERIAENNYEEFIGEGSQSAERTTKKRRIIERHCWRGIKRNFWQGFAIKGIIQQNEDRIYVTWKYVTRRRKSLSKKIEKREGQTAIDKRWSKAASSKVEIAEKSYYWRIYQRRIEMSKKYSYLYICVCACVYKILYIYIKGLIERHC